MFGQARFLVIDDEESMCDSPRHAIARKATRVEAAGDGLTELSMPKKEAFDLQARHLVLHEVLRAGGIDRNSAGCVQENGKA